MTFVFPRVIRRVSPQEAEQKEKEAKQRLALCG